MYHGDGSYKTKQFRTEMSLKELLETEAELVSAYNASVSAFEISKKSGLRTYDCEENINTARNRLDKARVDILNYIRNTKQTEVNMLNNNGAVVNLTRKHGGR